ncbi:tautomerase family protein [Desulfobacula phenolica]|uniref:4-oxalocrotonate tautomerase n=1 Tax=Desulfobacula phenolica TaxID=90732 RepID=A0A1H2JWM0_9BACT|nr:tautomerase family protein [Desulfobacula phenolica]SDU60495.1 4-oxalocrotonate tautomerase [Desulfobacula phenolica]
MPHIIVKLYPGRSEQQKIELTKKIVQNVVAIAECKEASVSVSFEEIEPIDWAEKVYKPDIINGQGILYKKPEDDSFFKKADKKEVMTSLMEHVREAAKVAEKEDMSGNFNAMSWLDLEIEDNPESFDSFFDTPWNELSDAEREERSVAIRRVL